MKNRPLRTVPANTKPKKYFLRRTRLKFKIPFILDYVSENETASQLEKFSNVMPSRIRTVLSNPWVISIVAGILVVIATAPFVGL